MSLLLSLTLICCLGCFGAAFPFLREYPATITLTDQPAGLERRTDPRTEQSMRVLAVRVRASQLLAKDVFATTYIQPDQAGHPVVLFGATEFVLNPARSLDDMMKGFADLVPLSGVPHPVPAGRLGGEERCGPGTLDGDPASVCGWADHGSIAVGVFVNRDEAPSAQLLRDLRAAVLHRKNFAGL